MTTTSSHPVTVSAPGKMLLVGGYLVLERHIGWVVAADQRFYTTLTTNWTTGSTTTSTTTTSIRVASPQFHSEWNYEYDHQNGTLQPSTENPSINPFVEKTLRICFLYLWNPQESPSSRRPRQVEIVVRADNAFYSVLPHLPRDVSTGSTIRTLAAVQALPPFCPCPVDAQGRAIVRKTGLGSSAALTTSLVGALVNGLAKNTTTTDTTIHNLAQICHCHAQGKVGSGFDVSAACYGTHIYRRFPMCLLPDFLSQLEHYEQDRVPPQNVRETLQTLADDVWDETMVQPLTVPAGQLQVLLADVQGGSESPGMAKQVLQWKQQKMIGTSTIPHWDDLKRLNERVVQLLQDISTTSSIDYDALSKLPAIQWPATSPMRQLHDIFTEIRLHFREMGQASNVPIEPPEQTKLCDATSALPGVVTCLVPGAGGYDAVVCLYIDRLSVQDAIGQLWASWESPQICPLGVQASQEGLRVEETKTNSCGV